MTLSIKDYTTVTVVQATHHQVNVWCSASRGIQCSCMSLIFVSWTLLKSPGLWDKFDLDHILGKGDQLFKFVGKFRYLWMEGLAQEFLIENSFVNLGFLENKTGNYSWGVFAIYYRNCNSVQQIGTGALLSVNNYILGLIWGTDSIYLFWFAD